MPCDQAVSKKVCAWVQVESETVKARSPLGWSARLGNGSLDASSTRGDSRLGQPQRSTYAKFEDSVDAEEDSTKDTLQRSCLQDFGQTNEQSEGSMDPLVLPGANSFSRRRLCLQAGWHLGADGLALWRSGLRCHCS